MEPDTPLEPGGHTRVSLGQEDGVQLQYKSKRPQLGRRAATAQAPTSGGDANANNCITIYGIAVF